MNELGIILWTHTFHRDTVFSFCTVAIYGCLVTNQNVKEFEAMDFGFSGLLQLRFSEGVYGLRVSRGNSCTCTVGSYVLKHTGRK